MRVAQHIWRSSADVDVAESENRTLDPACVRASLKAARASQREEKGGLATVSESSLPQAKRYTACSTKQIRAWLTEIKKGTTCF